MKLIDLTLPMQSWMPKYPSDPEASLSEKKASAIEVIEPILDESGYTSGAGVTSVKYSSGYMDMIIRNHHGTHVDAPAHKLPNGKKISDYPLDKFLNSFELLNLTPAQILTRPSSQITLENLVQNGALALPKETRAIIIYTGFCDYFNDLERPQQDKERKEKQFPFLTFPAIEELLKRYSSLNILGIDSFSFDPRGSNSEVHREMLARDVLPLEILWNLKELSVEVEKDPAGKRTLYCMPLSIKGGDAAQTRAYAEIE